MLDNCSATLVAVERDYLVAVCGLGYTADRILGKCSWVAEMLAGNPVEQDCLQAANKQFVV